MSDIEDDNYSISSSESNLSNNDVDNETATFSAKKDKLLFNQDFLKNIQHGGIDDEGIDDEGIDDEGIDDEGIDDDTELVDVDDDKNNIKKTIQKKNLNVVLNDSDDDYIENNDDVEYEDDDDDEDNENEEGNNDNLGKKQNDENILVKSLKKNIGFQPDVGNDFNNYSGDEDSDSEDENYLQKFSNEINKNYILEFHPECINHNYDEIAAISKVTRDEFNIIIDPFHKTIPYLTKYEKTRVLGQRAKQIECGAKPLVKVPENIIDSYIIAELELQEKKIPFIIRRPIPGGGVEYWNLKDLENISF